ALVGVNPGTLRSPTAYGFGSLSLVTSPSYTFGSTMSYTTLNGYTTKLTLTGSVDAIIVLHTFTGTATDGGSPQSTLAEVSRGTFWGSTFGSALQSLASTLFSVTNNTLVTDSLLTRHTFVSGTQGTSSGGTPFEAHNAALYGANLTGGSGGTGAIFRAIISPFSISSPVNTPAVAGPLSLIEAADQNLYGVTYNASGSPANQFFKMTLGGAVTPNVHPFNLVSEGVPSSPL